MRGCSQKRAASFSVCQNHIKFLVGRILADKLTWLNSLMLERPILIHHTLMSDPGRRQLG